jgi:hypothetical protein
MKNKQILNLIYNLGLELTEYNHQWEENLRRDFEEVTTYLNN